MKDSLLTWIIFALVLSMFCGDCKFPPVKVVSPPAPPQLSTPAAESYPTVDHGTFLAFTTDNGQGALAVVYTNDAGNLTQQYFQTCYASHDCAGSTIIRDVVNIPAPIFPGDRILITRTADAAYAITKEE